MGEALDLAELDALANTPLTVTVGGRTRYTTDGAAVAVPKRTLYVTEIEVAELSAMLRACQPVFDLLVRHDMRAAILRDPDAVINAIRVGARLTPEDMAGLGDEEMVRLGTAVVQVNADFFVRRLGPAFVAAIEKVTKVVAGSPPSPGLSAQDSPTQM